MTRKIMVGGGAFLLLLVGAFLAFNSQPKKVAADERPIVATVCAHQGTGACDCRENGTPCSCGGACQSERGSCSCRK